MQFSASEGERYGLQVIIVPFSGGEKILWSSGTGRLEEPLLLDVRREGDEIHVVIPRERDDWGEWMLVLRGSVIVAHGPRGLLFHLEKKC
jgi:hypothetical protein